MSNLIKGASWTPLTAKDGLDAIEMLRNATSLPDVVLTDIEMPRMDGYELLAALKANEVLARLPVAMLDAIDIAPGAAIAASGRKRSFHVGNVVRMLTAVNPDFFEGTVVAEAARSRRAAAEGRSAMPDLRSEYRRHSAEAGRPPVVPRTRDL